MRWSASCLVKHHLINLARMQQMTDPDKNDINILNSTLNIAEYTKK